MFLYKSINEKKWPKIFTAIGATDIYIYTKNGISVFIILINRWKGFFPTSSIWKSLKIMEW